MVGDEHDQAKGFSVVDVRDPANPMAVKYVENLPDTWGLHLQVHEDLLLRVHRRDMFAQPEMVETACFVSRRHFMP